MPAKHPKRKYLLVYQSFRPVLELIYLQTPKEAVVLCHTVLFGLRLWSERVVYFRESSLALHRDVDALKRFVGTERQFQRYDGEYDRCDPERHCDYIDEVRAASPSKLFKSLYFYNHTICSRLCQACTAPIRCRKVRTKGGVNPQEGLTYEAAVNDQVPRTFVRVPNHSSIPVKPGRTSGSPGLMQGRRGEPI